MPPATSASRTIRQIFLDLGEFLLELAKAVLLSLIIILPIRYYLVQPFYVKGASMEPTFLDREYLLIDEISYRFTAPARGDVVVFRYPREPREYFIKRLIGLPGETVRIASGRASIINAQHPQGILLDESYLDPSVQTTPDATVVVPLGSYFVFGDNRTASLDSRAFGPVPAANLTGRVWLRAWPFSRWTIFNRLPALAAL